MSRFFFFNIFIFCSVTFQAQVLTLLEGKVFSGDEKKPIALATIKAENQEISVKTNELGFFQISVYALPCKLTIRAGGFNVTKIEVIKNEPIVIYGK